MQLTMDLKTSAEVLGVNPDKLKNYLQKEQPGGIIRLEEDWHISIFTLAKILDTTPEALLEFMEDSLLGNMLAAVENDTVFEGEEGRKTYQSYLAEKSQ
ncbi:hypothetical protein [Desulfobacca acetoxidans]|uniref:Preprotein translocase, SecY subunit n=1 Tax=Desulfobacca acetoxidans (strain ATCC 700848 / DSM 11109 / ASRB2) TaxID=880072 RepID=F2NJK6_DESAR|nr:hypothetical protein [Desulfobacca acetoxidans]AEB09518.1 preprotein translocase, SecY subunit [Desulfobacca acetoxidans DSM 11109]